MAGVFFAEAVDLAAVDLAGDFAAFVGAFLAGAFVAGAFLAGAFDTVAFLAGDLVAGVFLAGAFAVPVLPAVVLVAGAFLAVLLVAGAFLAVVLVAGAFLADFAAAAFLDTVAVVFFVALLAAPTALLAVGAEVLFRADVFPVDLLVAFFCVAGTCASWSLIRRCRVPVGRPVGSPPLHVDNIAS